MMSIEFYELTCGQQMEKGNCVSDKNHKNYSVNSHTITSVNIENGFGGNKEGEKRGLYQVYQ